MNKVLLLIFLFMLPFCASAEGNTRSPYVGIDNNRYGILGYRHDSWDFYLKQSIFSENIKYQYIEGAVNYNYTYKSFKLQAKMFLGSEYSGGYYLFGAKLRGEYCFFDRFHIAGELQPHYDSSLDYATCYGLEGNYWASEEIGLRLRYTNIPEFRIAEKRLGAGLLFKSGKLFVVPEISVPVNESIKSIRVLCSFRYYFTN